MEFPFYFFRILRIFNLNFIGQIRTGYVVPTNIQGSIFCDIWLQNLQNYKITSLLFM